MKILLHTCCGPCAGACIARLKNEGHCVTMYFSNSNIATCAEFEKRLASAKILAAAEDVDLVVDEYNHEAWLNDAANGLESEPEKGKRCTQCFRYSLNRTSRYASNHAFDGFATSLTVSPHKVSTVIFEVGHEAEAFGSARFLEYDFKKKNGFKESVRRANELGLYRQGFCGCEFSQR